MQRADSPCPGKVQPASPGRGRETHRWARRGAASANRARRSTTWAPACPAHAQLFHPRETITGPEQPARQTPFQTAEKASIDVLQGLSTGTLGAGRPTLARIRPHSPNFSLTDSSPALKINRVTEVCPGGRTGRTSLPEPGEMGYHKRPVFLKTFFMFEIFLQRQNPNQLWFRQWARMTFARQGAAKVEGCAR